MTVGTKKRLKIGNVNVVSIKKHFPEVQVVMDIYKFNVLGLNETRLGYETSDSEIRVDGYDIYRSYQMRAEVVSPFMLAKHILQFQFNDINNTALEIVCTKIERGHAKNFIIIG